MSTTTSSSAGFATIHIRGRFDFRVHNEFRHAYAAHPAGTHFVVDLDGTEYLDSSALGMLLLLRRHAGDSPDSVRIINVVPAVARILKMAHFDTLFTLG